MLNPNLRVRVVDPVEGIIEGYLALWNSRDEYKTWFDPNNPPVMGLEFVPFPMTYEHWRDEETGDPIPVDDMEIVGEVVEIVPDSEGLRYTARLRKHVKKFGQIIDELRKGILGTSTGSADHVAVFDTAGRFVRWLIAEVALTKNPAEQRMLFDKFRVKLVRSKTTAANVEGARDAPGVDADNTDHEQHQLVRQDGGKTMEELLAALQPLIEQFGEEAVMEALQQMVGGGMTASTPPDARANEGQDGANADTDPAPDEGGNGTPPFQLSNDWMSELTNRLKAAQKSKATDDVLAALQESNQQLAAQVTALTNQIQGAPPAQAPRSQTGNGQPPRPSSPPIRVGEDLRYQHLTPQDMALGWLVNKSAVKKDVPGATPLSEAYLRHMAGKLADKVKKGEPGFDNPYLRSKLPSLRSDEISGATVSGYGDEWVGVMYEDTLWPVVRQEADIWDMCKARGMREIEIPRGYESDTIPLEGADPTVYIASEQADLATSGVPDTAITSSKIATSQKSVTVGPMGCRALFTGVLDEDSLIAQLPNTRRQMELAIAEALDFTLINGDTETGASTNINDIADTPVGTEYWLRFNGFLKLALVTNTDNSVDAGATFDESDFLALLPLLGTNGINADDPDKLLYLIDMSTYFAAMNIASIKTRDVNSAAAVENGVFTKIWGIEVKRTARMNKANTSGKYDNDDASNNSRGRIACVRPDQWAAAWKRRTSIEVMRWPYADTTDVVAWLRTGLAYRDTEASAVAYNVAV